MELAAYGLLAILHETHLMPGLADLPRRRGLGALPDDYAMLLADAQRSMQSDDPVVLSVPEETPAEIAARRMQRSVRPVGGRQEGGTTKVLDKYVPHVVGGLASLPQRAFEASETRRMGGEYDPGPAVEATLNLMGTGSAFAQPGAVGIFGGRLAKTADHAALARAEEMAAKGAPREQIWNETGWFQGADQKWRFEIPDNASVVRPDAAKGINDTDIRATAYSGPIGGILRHDDLFNAYPPLWDIETKVTKGGGYPYQPSGGLNTHESGNLSMFMDVARPEQARSLALHELMHGVQTGEGFGRGASVGEYRRGPMFDKRARDLSGDLSQEMTGGVSAKPNEYIDLLHLGDQPTLQKIVQKHGFGSLDEAVAFLKAQDELRTPFSQYRRTAGEVEARNVQKRMDMTPEQRKATPPWLTEDVPADQQIVRFGTALGSGATDKRLGAGLAGLGQGMEAGPVRLAKVEDKVAQTARPKVQRRYVTYEAPVGDKTLQARLAITSDTPNIAHIDWIGMLDKAGEMAPLDQTRGALGTAATRDLLRQMRAEFPEVDKIIGDRISGARMGGGYDLDAMGPKTAFEMALPPRRDGTTLGSGATGSDDKLIDIIRKYGLAALPAAGAVGAAMGDQRGM